MSAHRDSVTEAASLVHSLSAIFRLSVYDEDNIDFEKVAAVDSLTPDATEEEQCGAVESTHLLAAARSPLSVSARSSGSASASLSDEESGRGRRRTLGGHERLLGDVFYSELRSMISLSIPIVATYVLEILPGLMSIVLVGHIQSPSQGEYLDATAMAAAFMNMFGASVGIGLATAMDTLCSQAFGAKEPQRMGVYLQTGVLVLAVFCIIVGISFYFSTDILRILGQPDSVSVLTGEAVRALLPGIPFLFLYELLRKVLQAQNISAPMFFVAAAANCIHIGLGYFLVYHTSMGWIGASVARSACNISFFSLLLPYVITSGLAKTFWTGIRLREALQGIPSFLSLGVPGMLQLCFEWWAFEVIALICGLLPNAVESIGANAVMMNISSTVYMIYLGVSISGNVRIGNALGAGDAKRARIAAMIAMGACCFNALLCATLLLVFHNILPSLFTHNDDIGILASELIFVGAAFQVPDAINGAIQGVFRGQGRQNLGAKLNFVAYYLLGIPVGAALAFWWGW
eukprot:CAMPEP_0113527724 /NCGR_PEP_ID=MMETSP0015_2-20120614/1452_1 /TAXON_ID=2838 /ORGANISM="Odontella" /LENGTH=516 /DNA_ID=CAMNT_0000426185 /DNA_START=130 /DNA_END=1677 /DNA_ORIENTATION=- /assembly_acc=CAM_ASM_000160